jgi:hypothetical protein
MEWNEETINHFKEHVEPMLPAEGADILAACNDMEDVPPADKTLIEAKIVPEKQYVTLDDVMEDLNASAVEEE